MACGWWIFNLSNISPFCRLQTPARPSPLQHPMLPCQQRLSSPHRERMLCFPGDHRLATCPTDADPSPGDFGVVFSLDLPVPGDDLPLICSFKMPSSLLDLIRTPSHDKQPSPDPCTSIVNQIQQSKQFFLHCSITPPPCLHCCCGAGRAEGSMQGWGGANLQCRAAEGPCASMGSFRVCLKLVKQMSCRATQETKFDDLCFSPSG